MEIFNAFLFFLNPDDYGLYINAICAKYIMHNHILHHISGWIQLQVESSQGRITTAAARGETFGKITSSNRENSFITQNKRKTMRENMLVNIYSPFSSSESDVGGEWLSK